MDFNTQRKAVAAVEGFGKKYKIFYPLCMLAVLIISLFCSAVRAVDMALSDDDGHFLGMNRSHKKRKTAKKREKAAPVTAEKRGFLRRAVSGLLAACFAVMVVPEGLEIVTFAASSVATASQLKMSPDGTTLLGFSDSLPNTYNYKNTLDVPSGTWTEIGETAFQGNKVISSIDLTGVSYVGANAFSGATSLTRVIIDGSQFQARDDFQYFDSGNDPFNGISQDAVIYIINSNGIKDTVIKPKLPSGFETAHRVEWIQGSAVPTAPIDVTSVDVIRAVDGAPYSFIEAVVGSSSSVDFTKLKLYGRKNTGTSYVSIMDFTAEELVNDQSLCIKPDDNTYIIRVDQSKLSGYDVIAARVSDSNNVYSTHYACSDTIPTNLTTSAQTLKFNLGGDNGLTPTVNWNSKDRDNVDYYIYTDNSYDAELNDSFLMLKDDGTITAENVDTLSENYYFSTLNPITSVQGYEVYLLEVFDPLNRFSDPSNYKLLTSGASGSWNNDGFFYYRITHIRVLANQLPQVTGISVQRNTLCNNEIKLTWNPVSDSTTGMRADGYYVYFDGEIVGTLSGYNSTSFTYELPQGFSGGRHLYNVVAYKEYSSITDDNGDPYKQPGEKNSDYSLSVDKYVLTTESINENEIVLKWTYPVTTNSTNPTGYARNEENFIINYSYALNDEESRADSISGVTVTPDSKNNYTYKITTSENGKFKPGIEYTFTVSQVCPDNTHEHFFTSNEARAKSAVKPTVQPVLTIENGNREFSVIAELPAEYVQDPYNPIAGYHMQIFSKNGDQKGDLLHDSYMVADDTGYAFERIQTFNESKGSNPASPLNNTEYIVELTPFVHSQHENNTTTYDLPTDPYNKSGYKPYPIEGDAATLVSDVATPTNNLTLRVEWNNSDKPSGRGALLTWNTVNDKAQYYRIIRRRLDGTKEENADIVLEAKYPGKGLGQENTYVDSTAPFAIYTPDPNDPNGDVAYYAQFEYEVEAVYADGTADPMPATANFQFKPSYASLSAPTDVKAVGSDGQITVTWISVDAADRYYIYRDDEETPIIKLEADGKAGKTLTYVDHPMDNSTEHTYSITSVYSVANNDSNDPNLRKLVESVKVSANGTAGDRFPPVTGLTGSTTDGSITVKWDKHSDKNVEYYTLIATRVDDNGNPISSQTYIVNGNTYTISNLDNGDLYTFEVFANKTVNGKEETSEPGSTISIIVGSPIYPPNVTASPGNRKVTVSWTPNPQSKTTDGYYISRYDPETGTYTLLASVTGTTYVDMNLENGKTYWYAVQSYKSVSWHTIVSDYSLPVQATPDAIYADEGETDPYFIDFPPDFTVTSDDGAAHLSWTNVSGADGYRVYLLDQNGVPVLLGTSTKNKVDYTGLINGEVYTYTVTAYKVLANGQIVESAFATPKSVTIGNYLAAPVDVTAVAGDGKVTLSWTAVTGATGYVVYAYNAAKNSFSAVGVVSKPGFVHEGLENGLTYSYMIAAYKTVGLSTQYSQYSLAVSATPYASADNSDSGNNSGNSGNGNSSSGGSSDDYGYSINIVGTVPEGISHSELISAYSDEAAFKQDIEIRFSVNTDSSKAIYDVLSGYAEGLDSFDIYPFDVSAYIAGTNTKVQPADGHYVMLTMPVPDSFRKYDNDFQVIHINSSGQMEILALNYGESDGIPLVQFSVSEFSPFAFVHYYTPEDLGSSSGASAAGAAGTAASGSVYALRYSNGAGYALRKRNRIYKLIKK